MKWRDFILRRRLLKEQELILQEVQYFSQKSGRSHASPAISANQKRESAVLANQRWANSEADPLFVKSTVVGSGC